MLDGRIGQHCSLSECHQRDFMPFECQHCGDRYCGTHRRPDDHKCPVGQGDINSKYIIICPICEKRIEMMSQDNADRIWELHCTSGDCEREQKVKAERDRLEAGKIKKCQAERCNKRLTDINRNQCTRCHIETCMHHRLPETHACTQKITSDPRLAKSKLLQLGKKNQTQAAAATSVNTAATMATLEANISAMGGMSQSEIEQQKRLLDQFQFGGAVPQQPQLGVSMPEVCQVCQARFRDVMELIEHSQVAHPSRQTAADAQLEAALAASLQAPLQNGSAAAQTNYSAMGATVQASQPKKETDRCPECGKAFALTELPMHMQQDHFIF